MPVTSPTRHVRAGGDRRVDLAVTHRRARRRHPWRRRALALVVTLAVLITGAAVALMELTPSVTGAEHLVLEQLAAHHVPGDDGVIPSRVAAALLATEDSRYYRDPALDGRGLVRAAWGAATANAGTGGATIELQLAKLLWTPGRSGPGPELEQVGLALKLDAHFSKRQILAMYLDAAYFGDGAYGITAAARHYFGLPAAQLSWAQATLLAGLVQAPTAYDPDGHLHLALERRDHVIERLVATGGLTAAEAAQVEKAPLDPAVPFGG